MEGVLLVEQPLRLAQGLLRRTNDALGLALDSARTAREWPAEPVTRSRAPGPAGGIAIALAGHAPDSARTRMLRPGQFRVRGFGIRHAGMRSRGQDPAIA